MPVSRAARLWTWIIVAFVAAFIVANLVLIVTARRDQQRVSDDAGLIRRLTQLDDALRRLEDALPKTPGAPADAAAWTQPAQAVRDRADTVGGAAGVDPGTLATVARVDDLLEKMHRTHVALRRAGAGGTEATTLEREFRRAQTLAVDEVRMAVQAARGRLSALSADLAVKWRALSGLGLIACGLALLLAVSSLRLQRSIARLRRTERALQAAKEAAEQASRAKSRFLTNMSHELRTPLNAIIGYSQLIEDEARDRQQPWPVADLRRIHVAGLHLLELISGLLDLSKIEAGREKLHLEWFDAGGLARDVATTVRPIVEANGNEFVLDVPDGLGEIRADLTRTRQILFNLLSNAGKFTERGQIRLAVSRRGSGAGECLEIVVADDGIGIAPGDLQTIFDDFAQGDSSTTRRYGGTGLGLAITRRCCEMMDGSIRVTSAPGEGSTFVVTIPARVGEGKV